MASYLTNNALQKDKNNENNNRGIFMTNVNQFAKSN
jgi:hypothetical protein